MNQPVIIFSHGQEGEPWGAKIAAMAETARNAGYRAESIDYRSIVDANERVRKLLDVCRELKVPPVLVGSSMGGYVATVVAQTLPVRGVFLLAPAFHMPGFELHASQAASYPIAIVHGWRDDVVPVDESIRYARENRAALHVIDSDHRMADNVGRIVEHLAQFLRYLV